MRNINLALQMETRPKIVVCILHIQLVKSPVESACKGKAKPPVYHSKSQSDFFYCQLSWVVGVMGDVATLLCASNSCLSQSAVQ